MSISPQHTKRNSTKLIVLKQKLYLGNKEDYQLLISLGFCVLVAIIALKYTHAHIPTLHRIRDSEFHIMKRKCLYYVLALEELI